MRTSLPALLGHRGAVVVPVLVALAACASDTTPVADPPPTPAPTPTSEARSKGTAVAADGSIYFAADPRAGDALIDPTEFGAVEVHPRPMDIYLSRHGEPVRRIIATSAHERCPVVSPDGSRLAYLEGTTLVMVPLDANGDPRAHAVRVDLRSRGLYLPDAYRARNHAGGACPQWSPGGRRLGYQVTLGDRDSSIYDTVTAEVHAVTLDGEDRVLASFATKVWHAEPDFAWSPGGDEIAYATAEGVWRAPLAGGTPDLVWRTPQGEPTQMLPMDYDRPISLAWSSRGEIAFTVRGFTPTEPDNPMSGGREHMTVVVIDPRSGRTLLEAAAAENEGTSGELWSPDGSRLVFTGPGRRIIVHDLATGSTVRVRPQLEGTAGVRYGEPTWSPDGQELLVRARSDRGIALVSCAVDGSSSEVRTPWTWALDWASLDDVDWSAR